MKFHPLVIKMMKKLKWYKTQNGIQKHKWRNKGMCAIKFNASVTSEAAKPGKKQYQ